MTAPSTLRIAFVSSHAQRGGAEAYLARLVTALPTNITADVVCLEPGPLVGVLADAGVPTTVIDTGRRIGIATSAVRLRRHLARFGADLVHANGVKAAATAAAALLGRPEPLLWAKHDHSWDGRLARTVARRCALVVGVSSSVLAAVQAVAEVRVVHPGVDVEAVDTDAARRGLREAIAAGADDVVLVAVGRLDVAKGFDTAIDVLAELRRDIPSARLAVIGGDDPRQPGTRAALLDRAARGGVGDQVHLLGHRADAQRLIAGADVVVVASRAVDARGMGREGFGLVAAEALALGVPVVGFRDGALPEVVGNAGVLVDPGDVDALSAAAHRVILTPGMRDELVSSGRLRAAQFTPDDWLRAMVAAYVDVVSSRGAR